VRPDLFKKFIDGHKHPMVRAFFDCENNVKYGIPPETWIRTLGKSVMELHIKEYRLNPDGQSGEWTNLRENGINWPEVRKALDEVGFNGYGTIEGSGAKPNLPLEEQAKRCDLILEGK
jgi:hexulose-6-phosphate isomerase